MGPIVMGLSVILGEILAYKMMPQVHNAVFGFFTVFFLTSSAFVINDIVDIEIDRINTPQKPLITGDLSKKSASRYGILLFILGLSFSTLLSIHALIFALCAYLLSLLYNLQAKKTGFLGNLLVSLAISTPLPFGALIMRDLTNQFIWLIALLMVLSNTGREITKGIADAEGDNVKKVQSIALVHGSHQAARLAAIFYLLTSIIGPVFFQTLEVSQPILLIPTLIAESGFVYSALILIKTPSREQALKVNTQINIWMMMLLLVLLVNTL
jgi:geranylgeranylglycerol-phosphate geranylgeranyltransferase